jgi:hypothetical protein
MVSPPMLFMGSYRASRQPCMGSAGNGSGTGTQARGPPAGGHGRAQARSRTRYTVQQPTAAAEPRPGRREGCATRGAAGLCRSRVRRRTRPHCYPMRPARGYYSHSSSQYGATATVACSELSRRPVIPAVSSAP